jgi:alpha-L-fucosidase
MINRNNLLTIIACIVGGTSSLPAQITERPRPAEWELLVPGSRFIDRFEPMPNGKLSSRVWGGDNVLPRYTDNGIEDDIRSYWGGNILKGDDGLYHLFVCGWPENSPKGHHMWPQSTVYHTVCKNTVGPFIIRDTIGPGHNPEIFRTKNGQYALYVIDGYYLSDQIDGPWSYRKFDFDARDRNIIEGLSNLTFAQREDGSELMVCRGGGIWISQTGLSPYNQLTDKRVYPPVKGEFEDPVVWRDNVQYNLIVNDWLGRIAFYLRSKDGVNWVTDPGEAYLPGIISVHKDGKKEDWFKYERLKIFQDEYGRAIQANFAVIDTLKNEDKANDRHSSKNISIPLNPGLLISMLNTEPITPQTNTIEIRIAGEKSFNPYKDIDVSSLRFGASTEVNFGRGCKAIATKRDGTDLIVTFDGTGNGITEDEFAPKLIGKTKKGKLIFGYTRLPWVEYTPPIVSARKPVFTNSNGKTSLSVQVENFGVKASQAGILEITCEEAGKMVPVGNTRIADLQPYDKTEVTFPASYPFSRGKRYHFVLTLTTGKEKSTFRFEATPVPVLHGDINSVASPLGTNVFQPNTESLTQNYKFPDWFQDAKFGIFIHWGAYAVPAFSNEWYARNMYQKDSKEYKHHIATYGPHTKFGYKDFIPMFKADKFNADEWVKVFKEAGARYIIPVAEHHDGFAMYDSDLNPWNAAKMGPHKDIIGLIKEATEKEGLIFGLSSHRLEHNWFYNGGKEFPSDVQDPKNALYGPCLEQEKYNQESGTDLLKHTYELVDKYQPSLIWFDWTVGNAPIQPYFYKFMSYYYNNSLDWGQGVVVNTKKGYPSNIHVGDVERGKLGEMRKYPWQTDTSVGKHSWCYIDGEENKSAEQIVHDLIDIVSKNGNLLLNIGPRADGTITDEQKSVLLSIGEWLKINGDAIYGTRCWAKSGEGHIAGTKGAFTDNQATQYTAADIRFTTKGNDFYATILNWSPNGVLIKSVNKKAVADATLLSVEMLGSNEKIEWKMTDKGLKLSAPKNKPGQYAYVYKLHFDKKMGDHLESEMVDKPFRHTDGTE